MTERNTTEAAARRWVEAYENAWKTNEPDDIRALFTDDAAYYTQPWGEPWAGADAIVAGWLEARDESGTYEFEWEIAGVDGDRVFVDGRTDYAPNDELPDGRRYRNLWVIDLDEDGRARSFTEWYMTQHRD
ncbi:nuclear transport factor 2 family protein [Microbacterium sp. ProA8]|uniref:nuclear transport factor 2 family protein n=1 Tax=Microbacterium chionoecetis TaxID=3153754 RepID=UPI003267B85B